MTPSLRSPLVSRPRQVRSVTAVPLPPSETAHHWTKSCPRAARFSFLFPAFLCRKHAPCRRTCRVPLPARPQAAALSLPGWVPYLRRQLPTLPAYIPSLSLPWSLHMCVPTLGTLPRHVSTPAVHNGPDLQSCHFRREYARRFLLRLLSRPSLQLAAASCPLQVSVVPSLSASPALYICVHRLSGPLAPVQSLRPPLQPRLVLDAGCPGTRCRSSIPGSTLRPGRST